MAMRQIDAAKAMRMIRDSKVPEAGAFSKGINKGLNIALSTLGNNELLPTVDAVEVVRCRDCKHYDEYTKKCYVFCHDCIEVQLEVDGDHFCSFGERRSYGS